MFDLEWILNELGCLEGIVANVKRRNYVHNGENADYAHGMADAIQTIRNGAYWELFCLAREKSQQRYSAPFTSETSELTGPELVALIREAALKWA